MKGRMGGGGGTFKLVEKANETRPRVLGVDTWASVACCYVVGRRWRVVVWLSACAYQLGILGQVSSP